MDATKFNPREIAEQHGLSMVELKWGNGTYWVYLGGKGLLPNGLVFDHGADLGEVLKNALARVERRRNGGDQEQLRRSRIAKLKAELAELETEDTE